MDEIKILDDRKFVVAYLNKKNEYVLIEDDYSSEPAYFTKEEVEEEVKTRLLDGNVVMVLQHIPFELSVNIKIQGE